MSDKELFVRAIIEMVGSPKDYMEQTLKGYIQKLKDDGVAISREDYAPAEEQGSFFSAFCEIDVRFKSLADLLGFCLDSMPSSLDILEPSVLSLSASDLGNFLNDFQAKLHQLDLLVRTTNAENELSSKVDKNAMVVLHNFVKFCLKEHPKRVEELSEILGIAPPQLIPILNVMMKDGKIKKEADTYAL